MTKPRFTVFGFSLAKFGGNWNFTDKRVNVRVKNLDSVLKNNKERNENEWLTTLNIKDSIV